MKVTIVPAQITTVEDRIAGRLSFSQLGLLLTPLLLGSILYVILPPFFGYTTYKLVIFIVLGVVCSTLAIRIRGQLLFQWLVKVMRYQLRPRLTVYTKHDVTARPVVHIAQPKQVVTPPVTTRPVVAQPLPLTKRFQAEQLLTAASGVRVDITKQGAMYVVVEANS